MRRSLVDSAHDWVEACHHGHRVGDEISLGEWPNKLEVHE
jgi:hypothetical protein